MEIPILIFVTVSLVSLGCLLVAPRLLSSDRRVVKKRLEEEFHQSQSGIGNQELFRNLDAISLSPIDEYALIDQSSPKYSRPVQWRTYLSLKLVNAAITMSLRTFVALSFSLGLICGVVGYSIVSWLGASIGAICGVILPMIVVNIRLQARQQRLQRQLPSAFELMARVLRAGQSVPQAFEAVAEAFEPPLSTEFANCQQQQALGLSPDVVFQELANRNNIVELRIFAMTMLVQRQMGGNLSEVLERLAGLVRQRMKLQQHIRTLTAEGRMQGWTLVVLPFVMFLAMYFVNRRFASTLLDHPSLILATLACMTVGMLWIRKIVRIEG